MSLVKAVIVMIMNMIVIAILVEIIRVLGPASINATILLCVIFTVREV